MRTRWLLLVLLATTPAFSAPKFPFIEAMKRLDSTQKKLEHLRGWHSGLAKENGISRRDGVRFEGLLNGDYGEALKLCEAIQEKVRKGQR